MIDVMLNPMRWPLWLRRSFIMTAPISFPLIFAAWMACYCIDTGVTKWQR